jgi:hypothetical protein
MPSSVFLVAVRPPWAPQQQRENPRVEPFCIMIDLRPGMILGPELTSGRNGIRQSFSTYHS